MFNGLLSLVAWFTRPHELRSPVTLVQAGLFALLDIIVFLLPQAFLATLVVALSMLIVLIGAIAIMVSLSLSLRRVGVRTWWVGLTAGILALAAGLIMPLFPGDIIVIGVDLAAVGLFLYGVLSQALVRRLQVGMRNLRVFRIKNGEAFGQQRVFWGPTPPVDDPDRRPGTGYVIEGEVADIDEDEPRNT